MSNLTNSFPVNEIVPHNVYFDGKVQSLGLETSKGKATLGVMKEGTYTFSASSPEKMIIISGSMGVKLHDADYQQYKAQDEFNVLAGTSFEVICDSDVAYLCYYG
ncbi:pyrimidine/purine nucleoside phosphorylase [Pedobacter sp. PAMC26386]|nr:pyrimidine/purine nucleoside phosphorylase [Pedobacter sp. PAMC26386]